MACVKFVPADLSQNKPRTLPEGDSGMPVITSQFRPCIPILVRKSWVAFEKLLVGSCSLEGCNFDFHIAEIAKIIRSKYKLKLKAHINKILKTRAS